MSMKSKMKSPEDAQAMGMDGNKRLLKKLIKKGFELPLLFFYDTAFQYEEKEEPAPLLFIGEKIPAPWKRYIKEKKQAKTFAGGNCLLTVEGQLKLEVDTGKGAKSSQLKEINKNLLRPFASAIFVESLMSEEAQEDIADKEGDFASEDTGILIAQIKALSEQAKRLQQQVKPLVDTWEKPLSDLKSIAASDKQIEEVDKAITVLQKSGFQNYLLRARAFVNGLAKEEALVTELSGLESLLSELEGLRAGVALILSEGPKLRLVKDPMLSEYPPISKDPFVSFGSSLNAAVNRTNLAQYAEEVKQFKE